MLNWSRRLLARMIVLTEYSFFIKIALSTSHADWAVETLQKVLQHGIGPKTVSRGGMREGRERGRSLNHFERIAPSSRQARSAGPPPGHRDFSIRQCYLQT